MDKQFILELVERMERSQLTGLEYTDGDGASLKLVRAVAPAQAVAQVAAPAQGAAIAIAEAAAQPAPMQAAGKVIKSPIVGVFYAAPAPGAQPFVQVGQAVEKGAVVCIVEAMKVLNEIESDHAGIIDEILVANGDAVEFGQPLMVLR